MVVVEVAKGVLSEKSHTKGREGRAIGWKN